jgi:disulfide bond formation protein DsbB
MSDDLAWYKTTRAWQIYGRAVLRFAGWGDSPCMICRYSRFLILGGVVGLLSGFAMGWLCR